jgi:hypothetical protein
VEKRQDIILLEELLTISSLRGSEQRQRKNTPKGLPPGSD